MTISELIKHLNEYDISGKGDASVLIANKNWHPITEADDVVDVLFIESYKGVQSLVLLNE